MWPVVGTDLGNSEENTEYQISSILRINTPKISTSSVKIQIDSNCSRTLSNGYRTKVHGIILNVRSRKFTNVISRMTTTTNEKAFIIIDENIPSTPIRLTIL